MIDQSDFSALRDIKTLVDVVYALCLPQAFQKLETKRYNERYPWESEEAPERKNEPESLKRRREFAAGIDGKTLDAMAEALLAAIVDFTPGPRRAALTELLDKQRELEALAVEMTKEETLKNLELAPDLMRRRLEIASEEAKAELQKAASPTAGK